MADYSYAEIRAGLVANLAPLNIQNTGYELAQLVLPAIEISPGRVMYDAAFQRGHDDLEWNVRLTVQVAMDIASQMKMDEYLAPTGAASVKALIETDKTLGGTVKGLQVTEASGFQTATAKDGNEVLYCDWTVELVA